MGTVREITEEEANMRIMVVHGIMNLAGYDWVKLSYPVMIETISLPSIACVFILK